MSEDRGVFYISFMRNESGDIYRLKSHVDLDESKSFGPESTENEGIEFKSADPTRIDDEPVDPDLIYQSAMKQFIVRLHPYHNVIELTSFFRSSLQAAGIEANILRLAEKKELRYLKKTM